MAPLHGCLSDVEITVSLTACVTKHPGSVKGSLWVKVESSSDNRITSSVELGNRYPDCLNLDARCESTRIKLDISEYSKLYRRRRNSVG